MVALLLVSGISLLGVGVNDPAYADWQTGEPDRPASTGSNTSSSTNTSTVKLSIGGDDQTEATDAGIGTVAYRKQTVTVELDNVADYYLKFYGAEKLTSPLGGVVIEGTGDNGVAGKDIQPGTWGYGWDYTSTTSDEELTYRTVPTNSYDLVGPELIDNSVTFTGKLNFAANFPTNATIGNYTSTATLTLIATPKANTGVINYWRNEAGNLTAVDAGTDEMQGVDSTFCSDEVGEGWTIDLRDNRDKKTYTIYKAADGNCWMGQNLALNATSSSGLDLTSEDTDLPNGTTWNLPESVGSEGTNENNINTSNTWDTSNYNVIQIRTGSTSLTNWKNGYGNYYSWPAATAGTGTTSITNADASASICPKGWKLPTYSGDYSFDTMTGTRSAWTTAGSWNGLTGVAGYYFGSTKTTLYKGANFWPAAGYYNGSLNNEGTDGYYWSRSATSTTDGAYALYFYSSGMNSQRYDYRFYGFSVRCVHDQTGAWNTEGGEGKELQTDLKYMQDITKSNFTTKYCTNNAATNALVPVGSTVDLTDSRDGKIYRVVKLEDGNCWMQQNLALGPNTLLTSADSDVSSNYTTPADTSSFNSSSDPSPNGQMRVGSTSLNASWTQDWGNYYSWNAATASTGRSVTSNGGSAASSICPKGWKLPTGGSGGGQFQTLFGANGDNLGSDYATKFAAVQAAPYKFPTAGYYRGSSLNFPGTDVGYWSRTSVSSTGAYRLFFTSGSFAPGTYSDSRYLGFSVRCVAEPAN